MKRIRRLCLPTATRQPLAERRRQGTQREPVAAMRARLPRVTGALLASATALALAACGSSDATGPGSEGISARIDGQAWSAAMTFAGPPPPSAAISVSGLSGDRIIGFGIPGNEGTGTFILNAGSLANASVSIGAADWQVGGGSEGSGTITITVLNSQRIAGSFEFTATASNQGTTPATRQVTQGQFNVQF